MKILFRLLSLPFAWILWTITYSYYWVIFGGVLYIRSNKIDKKTKKNSN